jgi:hypothetical protein
MKISHRSTILLACLAFTVAFINLELSAQDHFSKGSLSDHLNFKIAIEKRCMFGDFDALVYDMQYAKSSVLQLSLISADGKKERTIEIFEEMKGSDSKKTVKFLDKLLGGNYRINFPLFEAPSPGLYSLVICKDSSVNGKCSDKPVKDINEILAIYKDVKSGYVSEDNTYFYQPIIFTKDSFFVLRSFVDEKNINLIKDTLKQQSISTTGNEWEFLANAQKVASYPLQYFSNELIITLPVYSTAKCGQN